MNERIEALVQQLIALGMPEARARVLIDRIMTAPPTDEEIADALAALAKQ